MPLFRGLPDRYFAENTAELPKMRRMFPGLNTMKSGLPPTRT